MSINHLIFVQGMFLSLTTLPALAFIFWITPYDNTHSSIWHWVAGLGVGSLLAVVVVVILLWMMNSVK